MPTHSRAIKQRRGLAFDLLFDQGGDVSARFNLRFTLPEYLVGVYRQLGIDLEVANGEPHWRLPMAARYIVDRQRRIHYARVNVDYCRRPEPDETVAALQGLQEG